jgi:hypothetical protein
MTGWLRGVGLGLAVLLAGAGGRVWAQASALPSAQLPGTENPTAEVQKGGAGWVAMAQSAGYGATGTDCDVL